jgi:hypothetical protein
VPPFLLPSSSPFHVHPLRRPPTAAAFFTSAGSFPAAARDKLMFLDIGSNHGVSGAPCFPSRGLACSMAARPLHRLIHRPMCPPLCFIAYVPTYPSALPSVLLSPPQFFAGYSAGAAPFLTAYAFEPQPQCAEFIEVRRRQKDAACPSHFPVTSLSLPCPCVCCPARPSWCLPFCPSRSHAHACV